MIGCAGVSLLLGLSYYFPIFTLGSTSTPPDPSSTLAWPAPALGVALLWRRRVREWPLYLLVAAATLAFVGATSRQPLALDPALLALGLLGVALGAWLGRRWIAPDGRLDSSRRLLLFTLLLPVALSLLLSVLMSALLGVGYRRRLAGAVVAHLRAARHGHAHAGAGPADHGTRRRPPPSSATAATGCRSWPPSPA